MSKKTRSLRNELAGRKYKIPNRIRENPSYSYTATFAFYVEGEFYEFTPDKPCVGKMLLLTEEMYRLHVNEWKNFPWNACMYPQNLHKKCEKKKKKSVDNTFPL